MTDQSSKTETNTSNYFDRNTFGLAYPRETRRVKTSTMDKPSFHSTLSSFSGTPDDREYTYDDVSIHGDEAKKLMFELDAHIKNDDKVTLEYTIGNHHPSFFLSAAAKTMTMIPVEKIRDYVMCNNRGRLIKVRSTKVNGDVTYYSDESKSQQKSHDVLKYTQALGYVNAFNGDPSYVAPMKVASFFGDRTKKLDYATDYVVEMSSEADQRMQQLLPAIKAKKKVMVGYRMSGAEPDFELNKNARKMKEIPKGDLGKFIKLFNYCRLEAVYSAKVDGVAFIFNDQQDSQSNIASNTETTDVNESVEESTSFKGVGCVTDDTSAIEKFDDARAVSTEELLRYSDLFGDMWPLTDKVLLNPEEDPVLLSQQAHALGELGFGCDGKTQVWSRTTEMYAPTPLGSLNATYNWSADTDSSSSDTSIDNVA